VIDSRRCLTIFCNTSTTTASSSAGAVPVRSSMSRFLIAAWIRLIALRASLSPAFMAVTCAALMSSRIMGKLSKMTVKRTTLAKERLPVNRLT
jgi:hypothetical protein